MVKRCADAVSETVNTIKQKVIDSRLGHFDEIGTRVDKKLWWVHDASNCEFTYLNISPKRGYLGMEQCGVLPLFRGGQKWASAFIDLLMEMKKVKDKAIEAGKESLSYYHNQKFEKRYEELIKQAREKNPLPVTTAKKRGRKKKGKILALVERLDNYKASVCLFIHDFMVPFDNNQAERNIRIIKVKTKVSGCFRSEEGARDYLKIMSYVGTAHKQGHNAYDAIRNAISGCPEFIFE
ncbi:hypothetical protein CE91St62_13870 [Lachnospiraceae bacterium]|nr:hypothetical protein CE91St61_13970 [Lachnospiraceae bacterium]BDF37326.1 hypothetical protein CE91St62_13870 [Lachnospiraceae bacterium]